MQTELSSSIPPPLNKVLNFPVLRLRISLWCLQRFPCSACYLLRTEYTLYLTSVLLGAQIHFSSSCLKAWVEEKLEITRRYKCYDVCNPAPDCFGITRNTPAHMHTDKSTRFHHRSPDFMCNKMLQAVQTDELKTSYCQICVILGRWNSCFNTFSVLPASRLHRL